jgi:hypothetical protein
MCYLAYVSATGQQLTAQYIVCSPHVLVMNTPHMVYMKFNLTLGA